MNRRTALLGAATSLAAGVPVAAAQTDHPLAVQKALAYEVATPDEVASVLEEMVSPDQITVQINGFSLSPNLAGDGYVLLVLITAPV